MGKAKIIPDEEVDLDAVGSVWREFREIPDGGLERDDQSTSPFHTKCTKEREFSTPKLDYASQLHHPYDYIGNPNYSYNKEKINIKNAGTCPIKINDGDVVYNDGTRATKKQIAKDLNLFLIWVANVSEKRCQENNGTNVYLLFI